MAFTVRDYSDLVQLLRRRPEWQAELRQLILSEDFLALPAIMRDLAEAQRQSEARLGRLEAAVLELAEAQKRTEERLEELAEAQRRTEARLEALAEDVRALTGDVRALTGWVRELADGQKRLVDTVGDLKGRALESAYRDKVTSYFGRLLRRPQVVSLNSLWETLETRLPEEALDDLLLVDLVVQGRPRRGPEREEVWLAVEVATVVNEDDVARARRRAAALRQAGYLAVPVVAGESVTTGAAELLDKAPVVLMLDGRSEGWEAALADLNLAP